MWNEIRLAEKEKRIDIECVFLFHLAEIIPLSTNRSAHSIEFCSYTHTARALCALYVHRSHAIYLSRCIKNTLKINSSALRSAWEMLWTLFSNTSYCCSVHPVCMPVRLNFTRFMYVYARLRARITYVCVYKLCMHSYEWNKDPKTQVNNTHYTQHTTTWSLSLWVIYLPKLNFRCRSGKTSTSTSTWNIYKWAEVIHNISRKCGAIFSPVVRKQRN